MQSHLIGFLLVFCCADDESWNLVTCFCRRPFAGRPMIECSKCETWIHLFCAKIRKDHVPDVYVCPSCTKASNWASHVHHMHVRAPPLHAQTFLPKLLTVSLLVANSKKKTTTNFPFFCYCFPLVFFPAFCYIGILLGEPILALFKLIMYLTVHLFLCHCCLTYDIRMSHYFIMLRSCWGCGLCLSMGFVLLVGNFGIVVFQMHNLTTLQGSGLISILLGRLYRAKDRAFRILGHCGTSNKGPSNEGHTMLPFLLDFLPPKLLNGQNCLLMHGSTVYSRGPLPFREVEASGHACY